MPLLWQGGLAGSGAEAFGTQTEWREAFEDDSTEAEPVGFFCSSCAATYEVRRAEVGCARCGIGFCATAQVRGGRASPVIGHFCYQCREVDGQQLALAFGFG